MIDSNVIASFETTIEAFIDDKLSEQPNNLVIENYDVTITSQEVMQGETSRRILQGLDSDDSYLVVTTSLTAQGSPPAIAEAFPFQVAAHSAITKSSDELFKEIYMSTLKQLEETPDETKVDISNDGGKMRNIALGSSVAGAVVLISLMTLLVMQHRRQNTLSTAVPNNEAPPPTDYAGTFDRVEEVSSIDDSLSYPKNIPHCNLDQANQPADQLTLGHNHHIQPIDKNGPNVKMNSKNDDTSSHANLKKVSFVSMDEDSQTKTASLGDNPKSATAKAIAEEKSYKPDPSLTRLYEQSMPCDEASNHAPVRAASQGPKPSPGFKMFSCFADNTLNSEEVANTLTAQKILQNQYRSNSTPKSNTDYHGVYEVRAPPGGLGLVIDSGLDGPFVYEVKATSPLHGQVETGDKIISIDGWCCENNSAKDVANWIRKKPKKDEQVLVLRAVDDAAIDEESV